MEKLQRLFHGYRSIGFMLVMGVIMGVVYFCGDNSGIRFDVIGEAKMADDYSFEGCDLFNGSWVYDNKSRPLYREKECSFMADDYACQKFGRKDSEYQFWRWQPHGCDLPRFSLSLSLTKVGIHALRVVLCIVITRINIHTYCIGHLQEVGWMH